MQNKHTRLPLLASSLAVFSLLNGCAGKLPSHDGSLNTIYGIEKSTRDQAVALAEPPQSPEAEVVEEVPQIQTLDHLEPIHSAPITAIEIDPQSVDQQPAPVTENTVAPQENPAHHHVLGAGETLYSVANQLTGTSSNWKQIADYNNIDDPGSVSVGQEILIPLNLVMLETANAASGSEYTLVSPASNAIDEAVSTESFTLVDSSETAVVPAEDTMAMDVAAIVSTPEGDYSFVEQTAVEPLAEAELDIPSLDTTAAQAVTSPVEAVTENDMASVSAPAPTDEQITDNKKPTVRERISSFASIIKTSFKLPKKTAPTLPETPLPTMTKSHDMTAMETSPVTEETIDVVETGSATVAPLEQAGTENTETAEWIQIAGDFTPKAVYKDAGYASGLLMRVPPGTTLKMTSQNGDWYQVETDAGAGYVFHRDASPVR